MKTIRCLLLLIPLAVWAGDLQISRLAGVHFKVADLDKARQFYTGMLGLEEAFSIQDSVFFKVNDDQYLELSPGAADGFELQSFSLATDGPESTLRDPGGNEIRLVHYGPGSKQTEYRGKALGARRVSEHLQHIGLPADDNQAFQAFYKGKLGFRELFRGGPNDEIRWINLAVANSPDILELMILPSQPAQGRRHIAFEVPNMQKAFQTLKDRGLQGNSKPNEGPKQNPRWILNLRDPNGIRVEIMGELVSAK